MWDMIDDCNINNLTKNQVSTVFHSPALLAVVCGRDITIQKPLSLSFAIEIKIFTPELRHIEINTSSSSQNLKRWLIF